MQFKRRLRPNANVDLVPMIDVVFQLVIFFMVSSTFIVTPGIELNLPESSSAEPIAMTRTVVSVVSETEVYLNRDRHTVSSLDAALRELGVETADGTTRSIVVEADGAVPYETMVRVLDVMRRNDFRGVNLRTREAPTD